MNNTIPNLLQVLVGLVLLNVWLIRFNKQTPYRGGQSQSMKEEFLLYGLPVWFSFVIGGLKIVSAFFLVAGIWIPQVVPPVAILISFLMIGAIAMHIKVRDPLVKSLPALILLIFCSIIIYFRLIR